MRLALLLAALALATACSRGAGPDLSSNFTTIQLAPNLVKTVNGKMYTGVLVAREDEIIAVARVLLDDKAFGRVAGAEPRGLVLRLPIKDGVPEGKATIYADLRSPRLAAEVRQLADPELLALARTFSPALAVAEATFANGKLNGPAVVFGPASDGRGTTKVGEITLRDNLPHGESVEYYPGTTQIHRRFRFEAGVQVGLQEWFHRNGKPERTATFVAGDPHGEWLELYENGAKRLRGNYDHGTQTGTFEEWFPTGKRRRETVFEGGDRRSREWYSNGNLAAESLPDQGRQEMPPDGVIEEFHGNGAVKTRTAYLAGVQHGKFEAFYSTGRKWKAGEYASGKQVGAYQEWWKNGQLALDSRYVDGVLDGPYKRFYASGKPWESATYVAGKLQGDYRKWWKNGKPAHVYAYKNGRLDGEYLTYYDNGAKWAVGKYVEGKGQGTLQRWFPDGKLGYTLPHENGKPHGPFKRWWADGKPRLEATYVRGVFEGDYKNFLEDGKLYEHAVYERGAKTKSSRDQPATAID